MLWPLLGVLLGIVLLYAGGELLVACSIGIARRFGISPLVIGLTIVAFATSSPELAATLTAALQGSPDIALGNAFGSNIANLGLILGIAVLVHPLTATVRFIRREVVFMVAVTIVVFPMLWGDRVARLEGVILIVLLAIFLQTLLSDPEAAVETVGEIDERPPKAMPLLSLGLAGGLGLLVGGAQSLIAGASEIALSFGISERVIGLTLVAFGTSLPELATSLAAARRQEGDIVLGNLIGSNIFNLLCILGITSVVHPIAVTQKATMIDFWVMLGLSLLVLAVLWIHRRFSRWQGAVLVATYVVYVGYLYI